MLRALELRVSSRTGMMGFLQRSLSSATHPSQQHHKCQLVVVGGGSGGCAIASKFARKLGKGRVCVVEPSKDHYYQPMWTMVGGGMKSARQSCRPMRQVLPKNAHWVQDRVVRFEPDENRVITENGTHIRYDFLVIAMGMRIDWNGVEGLKEALKTPGVSTNYIGTSAENTYRNLQQFRQGNAIFTFPNTPIKCPGAPQKIMYIADQYLRKTGKRDKANIIYNTSLPVLFGVEKYAKSLWKVVEERQISVNLRTNLIKVRPESRQAVFQNLDRPQDVHTVEYEMLHVAPPMAPPEALRACHSLVDSSGYASVDKDTLQHTHYDNVFALGDCSNLPTSKTAAAVAAESGVLATNLDAVMTGRKPDCVYDGYTSCPLVTGYSRAILAEFKYGAQPLETFPLDQSRESVLAFLLKRDFMPFLYWNFFVRGYWNGPATFRKLLHLGMSS